MRSGRKPAFIDLADERDTAGDIARFVVPHRTRVLQLFFGMVDVAAMLGDTVIATSR